ncbi:hypothetical protein LZ31DRAFT_552850 [Colletotrichum somersetense]|nr:hypothetical protein LZ31DRAFT_552850 [Colletotrichum somersetense]
MSLVSRLSHFGFLLVTGSRECSHFTPTGCLHSDGGNGPAGRVANGPPLAQQRPVQSTLLASTSALFRVWFVSHFFPPFFLFCLVVLPATAGTKSKPSRPGLEC